MKMKMKHLFFGCLILIAISLKAQVDVLWTNFIPDEYTSGITVDNNNHIIVGGTVDYTEIIIRKYDSDGNIIWTVPYTGAYDLGNIVTDDSNNIYISVSTNTGFNIGVLKLSEDGDFIWVSDTYASEYSWATDISMAPNGDVVAIGSDNVDDGWAAMRVSQDGSIIWQNSYNPMSTDNMTANSVVFDSDGNIIIVGVAGDYFAVLKCDGSGNLIWHNEINYTTVYGSIDASGVRCDGENNIYVVGSHSLDDNMRLVKFDENGNIIFEHEGIQNYACFDLVLFDESTIITGGGKGEVNGGFQTDIIIEAFDTQGNSISTYIDDIDYTDGIYRMAMDNDGNVVIVGQASSQNIDAGLVMKFNYITTEINIVEVPQMELNCYPNPTNRGSTISFFLEEKTQVNLSVYDNMGNLVKNLIKDENLEGRNVMHWNSTNNNRTDISSGIYYIILETAQAVYNEKIIIQ